MIARKILIAALLLLVVFFVTCMSMKKTTNIQLLNEKDIINISIDNRGVDSLGDDFIIYQKNKITHLTKELNKSKEVTNINTKSNIGLIDVVINKIKNNIQFTIIETSFDGIIICYEDELWKTHYYRNDSILKVIKSFENKK